MTVNNKAKQTVGQWAVLWDVEHETLYYRDGEIGSYIDRHTVPFLNILTKEVAIKILRSMPETEEGE